MEFICNSVLWWQACLYSVFLYMVIDFILSKVLLFPLLHAGSVPYDIGYAV